MENQVENADVIPEVEKNETVETSADSLIDDVLSRTKLFHIKTGEFLTDNRNMIGGALGVALGVSLEILSPTGSKTSAITAGVIGGGALMVISPILKVAPQSTGIAAGAGMLTSLISMSAGRIAADYFPGNLSSGE